MEQSSDMDECTASDDNSECDIGNTDKCICSAGYFEEFAACKGEYIGPAYQTFREYN